MDTFLSDVESWKRARTELDSAVVKRDAVRVAHAVLEHARLHSRLRRYPAALWGSAALMEDFERYLQNLTEVDRREHQLFCAWELIEAGERSLAASVLAGFKDSRIGFPPKPAVARAMAAVAEVFPECLPRMSLGNRFHPALLNEFLMAAPGAAILQLLALRREPALAEEVVTKLCCLRRWDVALEAARAHANAALLRQIIAKAVEAGESPLSARAPLEIDDAEEREPRLQAAADVRAVQLEQRSPGTDSPTTQGLTPLLRIAEDPNLSRARRLLILRLNRQRPGDDALKLDWTRESWVERLLVDAPHAHDALSVAVLRAQLARVRGDPDATSLLDAACELVHRIGDREHFEVWNAIELVGLVCLEFGRVFDAAHWLNMSSKLSADKRIAESMAERFCQSALHRGILREAWEAVLRLHVSGDYHLTFHSQRVFFWNAIRSGGAAWLAASLELFRDGDQSSALEMATQFAVETGDADTVLECARGALPESERAAIWLDSALALALQGNAEQSETLVQAALDTSESLDPLVREAIHVRAALLRRKRPANRRSERMVLAQSLCSREGRELESYRKWTLDRLQGKTERPATDWKEETVAIRSRILADVEGARQRWRDLLATGQEDDVDIVVMEASASGLLDLAFGLVGSGPAPSVTSAHLLTWVCEHPTWDEAVAVLEQAVHDPDANPYEVIGAFASLAETQQERVRPLLDQHGPSLRNRVPWKPHGWLVPYAVCLIDPATDFEAAFQAVGRPQDQDSLLRIALRASNRNNRPLGLQALALWRKEVDRTEPKTSVPTRSWVEAAAALAAFEELDQAEICLIEAAEVFRYDPLALAELASSEVAGRFRLQEALWLNALDAASGPNDIQAKEVVTKVFKSPAASIESVARRTRALMEGRSFHVFGGYLWARAGRLDRALQCLDQDDDPEYDSILPATDGETVWELIGPVAGRSVAGAIRWSAHLAKLFPESRPRILQLLQECELA